MYVRSKGAAIFALLFLLPLTSVNAADLGGDCCADLEERISELEATTARKGNRKVSLTISGWVSEQIVYWDDGEEQNVYLTSLGTAFASNFNFKGEAKISPDLSAGYVLHVEAITADVYTTTQDNDNGTGGLSVLYSYWFLKSDKLGKFSVGKLSPADDSAVVALDSSGTLQAAYWVAYDVFGFNVRGNFAANDSLTWGNSSSCRGYGGGPGDCNGVPLNVVRYDTPVLGGFSGSASWGEDDNWALAARYVGEVGAFKLAAVATYSETTDSGQGAPDGGALEYTQASVYAQHVPSGLFAQFAFGHLDQNENPDDFPATDTYYVKAGNRLKLVPIGSTIPYGEYLHATDSAFIRNDNGTATTVDDTGRVVDGSSATFWGAGVVQEIDAASMSVWLRYRDHEVDVPGVDTEHIKTVVFGAFIPF
jgi:hypothetical protein